MVAEMEARTPEISRGLGFRIWGLCFRVQGPIVTGLGCVCVYVYIYMTFMI